MADDRKKEHRGRGEPALEFRWDPLVPASDGTFSTTIRIQVSGWWLEGRPNQVVVSHYQRGQEPPAGDAVRIQKGQGTFPLTGLNPGHHYHVVAYIGDRLPVQNIIFVPELPRPKKPEQEKLESEQIELERARIARQLKREKKEDGEPTDDEKKTADLKAKTEQVQAEKALMEAEEALKKATPPQGKRSLKVVKAFHRPLTLEVFLRRIGTDGKPEAGEVSAWYFDRQLGKVVVLGHQTSILETPVVFSVSDVVSKFDEITFFLPDYPEVEVIFKVPARNIEEPKEAAEVKSANRRISEAWQRGRQRTGRSGR